MSYKNDFSNNELPFPCSQEQDELNRLNCIIGKLEHDLFFLYVFLTSNELSEEACGFLESHEDDPIPFRIYS